MKKEVLFLRVPPALKREVVAYAMQQKLTVNKAITKLLKDSMEYEKHYGQLEAYADSKQEEEAAPERG